MKHPVKLTALLYLKEALLKQQYELCPDIITVAKEFGAASFERFRPKGGNKSVHTFSPVKRRK